MRIDASQVLGQGGIRVKAGTGALAGSLREGDIIRAEVLSNEKGLITAKTEGGQTFKAKLDADIALLPGDKIMLEVSGKEKGLVLISGGVADDSDEEMPGQTGAARGAADKSLEPYLDRLAELKMPANPETARLMRDLMALNPKLTMDEAAFLASNKITGDADLIKAALAVLSDGDKTDVMIARLLALLGSAGTGESGMESGIREDYPGASLRPSVEGNPAGNEGRLPESIIQAGNTPASSGAPPFAQGAAQASSLTDLLMLIISGAGAAGGIFGRGEQAAMPDMRTIITQNQGIMQSTNVENIEEIIHNDEKNLEQQALASKDSPVPSAILAKGGWPEGPGGMLSQLSAHLSRLSAANAENTSPLPAPAELNARLSAMLSQLQGASEPDSPLSMLIAQLQGANEPNSPLSALISQLSAQAAESNAPLSSLLAQLSAQAADPGSSLSALITERASPNSQLTEHAGLNSQLTALLSEIPEFRGTPVSALERFSNMLLRVAGESAETIGGSAEKLDTLIDKLFTRIDRGDPDAGARLRTAREELFTRLALIEEAISRAAPSARAEMLEQTHRLMEHVRLLNSIDQFAYMQLPVQLENQRKAAELYLFKRKGGRKPDPENVNILLALDLENMGRWESFINIRKKDVSIQMEVRGAAEKEFFRANTVKLHDLLDEAGFRLVSAGITATEEETTPLTALSSLGRHTTSRAGAIDFLV